MQLSGDSPTRCDGHGPNASRGGSSAHERPLPEDPDVEDEDVEPPDGAGGTGGTGDGPGAGGSTGVWDAPLGDDSIKARAAGPMWSNPPLTELDATGSGWFGAGVELPCRPVPGAVPRAGARCEIVGMAVLTRSARGSRGARARLGALE